MAASIVNEVVDNKGLRQRTKELYDTYPAEGYQNKQKEIEKLAYEVNADEADEKIEKPYSIGNLCWFFAAVATFYLTDFYQSVRYDSRVNRLWFNAGVLLISVNVSIGLFLIVWLTFIKKVNTDDWEKLYPMAIPIASAAFCFGSILVIIGLWPVWSFFTPIIMGILFMGFIVLVMLIPPYAAARTDKPVVTKIDKDL